MRVYIGSAVLLLAIVSVFGVELAMGVVADDAGLIGIGALRDTRELNGEFWRVLSFGFLHWDLKHLLLNASLLFAVGPIAERRLGATRLLLVFMASSILSGAAILLKHHWWPTHGASVGASGGMFGLIGLALVSVHYAPPRWPMVRHALFALAAGAFGYSIIPGVSMVGHVTGFAVGLVSGLAMARASTDAYAPLT